MRTSNAAETRSTRAAIGILALFWAGVVALLVVWLWRDRVYAPWDFAHHAMLVRRLHDGWLGANPWSVFELSKFYPPLFHVLAVPAAFVTDVPDAYCFGSWIALLALMIGTWLLGRTLHGSDGAALAAGFLVASYLFVTWMGRQVMTDLTLAASVALALWRLSLPEPLRDRRAARWLGVTLALGMLAKWSFAFFVAAPLALVSWRAWRSDAPSSFRTMAAWAIVPIAPWYVRSLPELIGAAGWHLGSGVRTAEGDPSVFSAASLAYYPGALFKSYLTSPQLVLLGLGSASLVLAWRRDSAGVGTPSRWLVSFLSVASGLACLVLIANKDHRFVLPVVSVLAVVSTAWIALLPRGRALVAAAVGVVAASTIAWNLFRHTPPDPREWRVEEAGSVIAARMRAAGAPFRVLVVPNGWHMNWLSLQLAIESARREGPEEKVWVDRLEGPLGREVLQRYGTAVLVDPPPDEEPVSAGTAAAAEWMKRESGWEPYAAFTRDDGRTVLLLEPPPSPVDGD